MVAGENRKYVPHCDHVRHCNVSQKVTGSEHNSLPEMLAVTVTVLMQHIMRREASETHIVTNIVPKIREFAMNAQSIRRLWSWR